LLYPNYDNYYNAVVSSTTTPNLWTLAGNTSGAPAVDRSDTGYGAGVGNFLSWGGFPETTLGSLYMRRGYKLSADIATDAFGTGIDAAAVRANLREHLTHSRYDEGTVIGSAARIAGYDGSGISDPLEVNRTIPVRGATTDAMGTDKYSWLKAPRWTVAGTNYPMEVGPMARMYVANEFRSSWYLHATVTGYTGYVTPYSLTGQVMGYALKPSMVGADLAVALVRSGLAELRDKATGDPVPLPTTYAGIAAAYNDTKVITGIILAWIMNLRAGLSTMDRLRGRALESLQLCTKLAAWSAQLSTNKVGETYRHVAVPKTPASGFGAAEAPRGALMHAIHIDKGKIVQYQCIVPTTWNAMIGIPYVTGAGTTFKTAVGATSAPTQGGVEALRVAQSFDPCIACAVH
jgi:Ni,Fe-hydrogenase I large subunit